ncbi:MAG: MltA domain-containing protein [Novosphingobium sp.]
MGKLRSRALAALMLPAMLAGCGQMIPGPGGPALPPRNALGAGVHHGPAITRLDIAPDDAAAALSSFRESCPRLVARVDNSGLTQGADWKPACQAAAQWPAADARGFFQRWFEAARIAEGKAHATGYYEPEIEGSRRREPDMDVPIYRVPPDLVRARPGDAPPDDRGRQPLGRYDAKGRFVPYHDRAAIEDGALMGRGLEMAWAADPGEYFFLQVQGSGRLRAPDGSIMRLGYAGQNGHAYTGIGGVLRERGIVGSGPGQISGSMQSILRWLHDNPEAGRELMRQNRSYVFFREITGEGPVGALNVPVRGRSSAAVDPAFVPLGAPMWLELDRSEANGLWIAQDTGGAIKGANRIDTFWGAGSEARHIAGRMSARGKALILLPKGTLDRLGVR